MKPSEVGALLPATAFNIALDESWDDWRSLTIKVQAAETAGLPLGRALTTFFEQGEEGLLLPEALRRNLSAVAPADMKTVWIRIVTNVIYMRAIDITIRGDGSPLGLSPDVEASELTTTTDDDPNADDDLDPAFASIPRANAMNREMSKSGTDALPDSSFRFLAVNDEMISMRRLFRRGIAIAVRGFSLRVDPRTGTVEQLGLMGAAPTVDPAAVRSDGTPSERRRWWQLRGTSSTPPTEAPEGS